MSRAQTAEAKLATLNDAMRPALEKVKDFKANFGVKEKDNGDLVIDFDKFAERLGIEGALELRSIIDEKYNISGKAGEKPHIKVVS